MKRTHIFCILLAAFFTLALAAPAQAPTPAETTYRLDFVLHELQNGKQVSDRSYSLVLTYREHSNNYGRIRIGGSVPVKTEGSSNASSDAADRYTYKDIGFSLDCSLPSAPSPDSLPVNLTAAVTSIVPPSQPPLPIFRTASASVNLTLPIGKRVSVAKLEDLSADDTYELEVQVTPITPTPAPTPSAKP